jgi:hypothetical protein
MGRYDFEGGIYEIDVGYTEVRCNRRSWRRM